MIRITCKHSSELISQSLERRLTRKEQLVLRLHLLMCIPCNRFKRQLEWLRKMIGRMSREQEANTEVQLSAEAKERIRTALSNTHRNS